MTDKYGEAKELLRGGYDLHAHSFPSHVSRSVDDFELLEQAAGAGMAGVMIKNHYESTAGCRYGPMEGLYSTGRPEALIHMQSKVR